MHGDETFSQAAHAAELAGLAAYAAAVLHRAAEVDPAVVALRLDASSRPGEPRLIGEFIRADDVSVGGFAL